jgi:hypothetical protein
MIQYLLCLYRAVYIWVSAVVAQLQPLARVDWYLTMVSMELPYRLDLMVDLFELTIGGVVVLLDQEELTTIQTELAQLRSCWPEPKGEQVWAVVVRVLSRDPRDD